MVNFLESSLKQLNDITMSSYNAAIMPVALALWQKHLQPENPQWQYITAKPFYIREGQSAAHVLAMVDSRLPGMGYVGYFACTDSVIGAKVLNEASDWLKKTYDLTDIYGPINGTLPSDYRLNLRDDFCFPGEPVNPSWHIEAFHKAGFDVFNRYVSGRSKYYQLLMRLASRKPKKGYQHLTIRHFSEMEKAHDFEIYHNLRNDIFPLQSVYCPAISLEERTYHTGTKFDPKYCFFLVDKNREVGFIMAYTFKDQLVLKTIGVLPEYRGKRLTGMLIKPIRQQAKRDQLKIAIYAMVREGNAVHKSKKFGVQTYRQYVTMHKKF